MDKKLKIRIIIAICAVVIALVVAGVSTGFFSYILNARKSFDDSSRYIKNYMVIAEECHVEFGGKGSASVPSTFGGGKRQIKISADKKTEDGKTTVTVILFNDVSFASPLYLTPSTEDGNKKFSADLMGDKLKNITLGDYDLKTERYKTKLTFTIDGDIDGYQKIALKNLAMIEYKRR